MRRITYVFVILVMFVLGVRQNVFAEDIKVTIKNNKFDPSEIRVKANAKAQLIITNADSTAEEFESFDLNREKMIKPGQTVTVKLPKLKPGRYKFFGEFHPDIAKGEVIVEE